MTRFLIEVPHENKKETCDRAVRIFMETGSHFMTNAEWGCGDDVHKAWFIVDMDSKDEARARLCFGKRRRSLLCRVSGWRISSR